MDAVTPRSSYANLPSWFHERFPFINIFSAVVMYLMLATAARVLFHSHQRIDLILDIAGGIGLACFFLLMRVSDEFKDFEVDSILYPGRVLQSGRIELKHLTYVGLFAGLLMLLASLTHPGLATWACLVNLGFAGLLNREFFCGRWLRRHILLYSLSHMFVAVTSAFWVIAMTNSELSISQSLIWLLGLPYFSGLVFEFARKSFGTEENKKDLESYSRILGVRGASLCLIAAAIAAELVFFMVVSTLFPNRIFLAVSVSAPLLSLLLLAALQYWRQPTKRARKINEAVSGLFLLGNYFTILGLSLWS